MDNLTLIAQCYHLRYTTLKTYSEISEKLGISRSAVYQYVKDAERSVALYESIRELTPFYRFENPEVKNG